MLGVCEWEMIGWIGLGIPVVMVVCMATFATFGLFGFHWGITADADGVLQCLLYGDPEGTFAIIRMIVPQYGGQLSNNMAMCDTYPQDIAWLIHKGYHIDHVNDWDAFLVRPPVPVNLTEEFTP